MFWKSRQKKAAAEAGPADQSGPGVTDAEGAARSVDSFLKLSGLVLAVASGLLPLAAYVQNARTTHVAATDGKTIRDPLDRSHQRTMFGARKDQGADSRTATLSVDPNFTGTTQAAGSPDAARPTAEDPRSQPFPARPQFLLRDVVGGMGMIEDQTGFWFVEKGSLLPDASHVAAITNRDGLWQITTDAGRVIRQTP